MVISEHILDLVVHAQARIAQEPRLPELRDPGPQQHLVSLSLALALQRFPLGKSCAIERSASRWLLRWTSVGCAVSTGDTRAAAQHRRDGFLRIAGRGQTLEGRCEAAILWKALRLLPRVRHGGGCSADPRQYWRDGKNR